jgi:hypothetical protein
VHTHRIDGEPRLSRSWHLSGWRGWLVVVDAEEPARIGAESLDADTREQLAAVAAGNGAR